MTNQINDVTAYLNEKSKQIEQANELYIGAKTRLELYRKEYADNMDTLKKSGINSLEELEARIKSKEKEVSDKLVEIEKLMPADVMNQYKDLTIDQLLDQEATKGMNLDQQF